MTDLELRAKEFATRHHAAVNHVRKYTGEPYIVHPEAVAAIVRKVPHTPEVLAAAWLHDTVEDTKATPEEILQAFGPEVAELVEMLTEVSRPTDGNRARRKQLDLEHTAKANPAAQTIKLADLIDNTRSILAHDSDFAVVYLREKAALLRVLTKGDPVLHAQASVQVAAARLRQ
jgi:(p)ppGpp synthase/HD superfamily hydrolase